MKEYKDIEHLIEKFYNGETSLEDEKQLHVFFQGESIPDHLKSYKDQFLMSGAVSDMTSKLSSDDLFAKLDQQEAEETKVVEMKTYSFSWVYKVAAAVTLVLVGFWVGNQLNSNREMSQMQAELKEMKNLMFAQMEGSSASGRLQAVNNSMDLAEADDETVDVLIALLKNDESMHVRTKTVEALTKLGGTEKVTKAFSDALLNETEPAVQIALIEGLVSMKEDGATEVLERITKDEKVLKEVQEEAHLGIFKLKEL
ncbi:HEAT repeat domain-containing protein [Roseivirga sp. E12]|uniref:HEAT repeat domain-containing protein n=1 Tax=Roseivirga sp. E12 TaxID=2819237 RepID=UPI001ABD00A0|nr:HEAT repeat domain-containing protein [Roseivirga sp. E12]MBO3697975.1 HEAT repeat domain-containing protein [Roseivirga sp. E12]